MINAVLRLAFGGRWHVQFVLALLALGAAGYLYQSARKDAAEMAVALEQGPPAPVSLNTFDPSRDIHPAKEVHVTGWINTDYTYQLTEEHRKRSDVVRRMFVLFGPEDTSATKTARAVVLMPEGDVDRFVETMLANLVGQVEGNPLFTLSGTARTSATLDNMAEDALEEKGLTKAAGFRYIEIWPASGRAAALAPSPEMPLIVAAFPGLPGLLLLLVSWIKFSRRKGRGAVAPANDMTEQHIRATDAAAVDRMAPQGTADAPLKGLLKPQTLAHPTYNPSPNGTPDEGAAGDTAEAPPLAAVPTAPMAETITRSDAVAPLRGVGRAYGRFKQACVAVALLGVLYVGSDRLGLGDMMAGMDLASLAAAVRGAEDPVTEATTETPSPDARTIAPSRTETAEETPSLPMAKGADLAAAAPSAGAAPVAALPAHEPATAGMALLTGLALPSPGQLLMILSVVGAVLLMLAAFALMRGRQAAPPAVFAGRDPWEKLAKEARCGHVNPA